MSHRFIIWAFKYGHLNLFTVIWCMFWTMTYAIQVLLNNLELFLNWAMSCPAKWLCSCLSFLSESDYGGENPFFSYEYCCTVSPIFPLYLKEQSVKLLDKTKILIIQDVSLMWLRFSSWVFTSAANTSGSSG